MGTYAALSLVTLLLLVGCDADDRPPGYAASLSDNHLDREQITGTARYSVERLSADGQLQLQLLDLQTADITHATIAETTVRPEPDGSSDFMLPFDPARLRVGGRYGVQASLLDAGGNRLQGTSEPLAVTPGAQTQLILKLQSLAPTPAALPATTMSENWQCDELAIGHGGLDADGRLRLAFSGRVLKLEDDGQGYSDAAGNRFRNEGDRASLTLAGMTEKLCVRSQHPSPWNKAAARGVGFRAMGNEPGWFVEVDIGEAPVLRATLDYGQRSVQASNITPLKERAGYRGTTSDGAQVTLTIHHGACQDGMSGERFEASARLSVGNRDYQGCGAYLFE